MSIYLGNNKVNAKTPNFASGTKYIWTDIDGEGAWNVSGYNLCSVDGAPIKDGRYRVWLTGVVAGVQYEAEFTSTLSATKSVTT